MPKRNIVKQYGEGEFYHCYNRGVNGQDIFQSPDDFGYFLSLFKRHLSSEPARDRTRRLYPHYAGKVELAAYCLMPNHYHLLLYLKEVDGIELLMRSVMTAYSGYFNRNYSRTGKLFEGHFLASRITSDEYLWHVSQYIHLNPLDIGQDPQKYEYSSLLYFRSDRASEWVHPEWLVRTSDERSAYVKSLVDHEDYHELRHAISHQLADE